MLEKLRTIRLVPAVEEGRLYWTLSCTDCKCSILHSKVFPKYLKDLLHLLPELFNQHYMTSVCFIDNSSSKNKQFTSSVFSAKKAENILQSELSFHSKDVAYNKIKGAMNNTDKEKYLRLMNSLRVNSLCTRQDGIFKCQW